MYKISEFSRLGQVTTKTLRYYADIGLLPPAQIDPWTNYRYFSADQLPRLRRIQVLKGMGFQLSEIGRILDQDLDSAEIIKIAQQRRAGLAAQLETQQQQLAQLDYWLERLAQEQTMTDYQVTTKTIDPILVTYVRKLVPTADDLSAYIDDAFGKAERLAKHNNAMQGTYIAEYYDQEWTGKDIDMAGTVILTKPIKATNEVDVRKLDGGLVAFATHIGPYCYLPSVYQAVLKWVAANNYRVSGPSREVYLPVEPPMKDQSNCITEVQFFVDKMK